jgi:hypothetical protein
MGQNVWLPCNAWPAEEASTRPGMRPRPLPKRPALTDLGIGGPAIGSAIPEEAPLPRSNTGDRASDIYRGAVLPVKR